MKKDIYLDEAGYQELLLRKSEIKKTIEELTLIKGKIPVPGESEGWYSTELLEIERQEGKLYNELKTINLRLLRATRLEKHNLDNLVDIDDVINIDMIFEDSTEEMTIKLVGTNGDLNSDITEVSINSPLGRAVYKTEIGEMCNYEVNNCTIDVFIKSKVNVNKKSKKLVKTTI